MLTKEDLQAIERIVDKSFDKKFNSAFDKKSMSIYSKLNKIQKDINTVVRVFDSDIVDLKDRTEKLEAAVFI